jgi:hypothetical protein
LASATALSSLLHVAVEARFVEEYVDDLDGGARLTEHQSEKDADGGVTELHVEQDCRQGVPAHAASGGQRVFQRSVLEIEFGRGIDQILDIRRLVGAYEEHEVGNVGEPQFGCDIDDAFGDDFLEGSKMGPAGC